MCVSATVPSILKDALQVTSQSIEGEMAVTLKMAYQITGQFFFFPGAHTVCSHWYAYR